ncbi:MAG: aldolase [Methanomicrobiales archaeon]|nr:aldolase [Methanomicrobiales archaeon]NYT20261.1 aldolase [Methanomicrobiales archaeon]
MQSEFGRIGKRLFAEGLIGASFGNMSVRSGTGFFITRSGSYLDCPKSPVFVPMDGDVPEDASSEYRVHRAVYRSTDHQAVIHAHPPHAIALSLSCDRIVPMDVEGLTLAPVIPVVVGVCGSDELAGRIARGLQECRVTVARGHGTFAAGKSLDEAYLFTSLAEHSCRILVLAGAYGRRQD